MFKKFLALLGFVEAEVKTSLETIEETLAEAEAHKAAHIAALEGAADQAHVVISDAASTVQALSQAIKSQQATMSKASDHLDAIAEAKAKATS